MGKLLLDDLGDYVSSGSLGLTTGTNLFLGVLPAAAPDRCVLIAEPTGGLGPVHTMNSAPGNTAMLTRPRAQVWCRGSAEGYQGARQDAENVYHWLAGVRERSINGTRYLWMTPVSEPYALPPDENLRPYVTFAVDIVKDLSTSTST